MKMTRASFDNLWYVDSVAVDNIIIYDKHGVILDTGRRWLEARHTSNAIHRMDSVTQIAKRNKVKFDRPEHFFCKGVLYLHAALFSGYGTVQDFISYQDDLHVSYIRGVPVYMIVDGATAPEWYDIKELRSYRQEDKPVAKIVDYLRDMYNGKVNRHEQITRSSAYELYKLLPEMAELRRRWENGEMTL